MDFKSFLLGLLICFLLSFLLGIERQYRRRFLGLRTMILVSVGSYLFVSFSFLLRYLIEFIFQKFNMICIFNQIFFCISYSFCKNIYC